MWPIDLWHWFTNLEPGTRADWASAVGTGVAAVLAILAILLQGADVRRRDKAARTSVIVWAERDAQNGRIKVQNTGAFPVYFVRVATYKPNNYLGTVASLAPGEAQVVMNYAPTAINSMVAEPVYEAHFIATDRRHYRVRRNGVIVRTDQWWRPIRGRAANKFEAVRQRLQRRLR